MKTYSVSVRIVAILLILVFAFPAQLFAQDALDFTVADVAKSIQDVKEQFTSHVPSSEPVVPFEPLTPKTNNDRFTTDGTNIVPEPVTPKGPTRADVSDDLALDEEIDEPPQPLLGDDGVSRPVNFDEQSVNQPTKADPSTGALQYSYDLTLPPGRNGMTPSLALTYSSNAQNNDSFLGYGWSFDIPYIERVNKYGSDKLYDNWDFNSSLTGELSSISTSTTATSTFISKVDDGSFLSYELKDNRWIVYNKSGMRYVFGGTDQSRMDDENNTNRVYRWMLEEARDTNNNYIKYEYFKNAGQIYPETITYTGHGSTDGIFEIEFDRSDFEMSPAMYHPDFPIRSAKRISKIEISENGQWIRKYELTIATSTAHRLLESITESGRDLDTNVVVTKSPVFFSYQKPGEMSWSTDQDLWELPQWFSGVGGPTLIQITDVNGDAYPDVVFSQRGAPTQTCPTYRATWINDTHGGWDMDCNEWIVPAELSNRGQLSHNDNGYRLFDYDGDQLPDLVQPATVSANNPQGELRSSNVYRNVLNPSDAWPSDVNNPKTHPSLPPFIFDVNHADAGVEVVDFNGDGLQDVAYAWVDDDSGYPPPVLEQTFTHNGTTWATTTTGWNVPWGFVDENTAGREVLTFNQFMDINGDGLVDYIFKHEDSGIGTRVGINNGHDWATTSSIYVPENTQDDDSLSSGLSDAGTRSFDVNGDGVTDLINAHKGGGGQFFDSVHLGTLTPDPIYGNLFLEVSASLPYHFADNQNSQNVGIVDINADGMVDMLKADRNTSTGALVAETKLSNGHPFTDLLVGIKSAEGASTTITYKMSTQYFDQNNVLLNPNLPIAVKTVNTIATNDGFNNYATTTYSYADGSYYFNDSHDRKFAGFGLVTETDPVGNVLKSYLHQGNTSSTTIGEYDDHIAKAGKPYRIEKYNSSGNLFSKTINKWDKVDLGNGASFVKLIDSVEFAYDGDSDHKEKATSFSYNNSTGNLTQKIEHGEVSGSNDGTFTDSGSDTFTTNITYATSTSSAVPYLYLPSKEIVTDQSAGKVRETRVYYDSQSLGTIVKGNPTKQEFWKTGSTYIDTEKTYDGYGLVTQEKDPRDKITTYDYESQNLYPATTTNPLGHKTVAVYDYSAGKPKQVTDQNGFVFQTVYDGFDRPVEEKQPDINTPSMLVIKSEYSYTDTGALPRSIHKTSYLSSGTSTEQYSYLDGFGRSIQDRNEAEDSYTVKDTKYGKIGKVSNESLPYFSAGSARTAASVTSSLYTNYVYDALYRPIAIGTVLGTTTNSYDDWRVTVTDPDSKTKILYNDARGNLIRVDEINGASTYTTDYEYDGNNNLTKITDALDNLRNFTYDGLGRRLSAEDLHDPQDTHFGTWTYGYDDAGNLTSSTDPKSQVIEYTYDDINRPTTENYTAGGGYEVLFGYDNCTNGIGRFCSATTTAIVIRNEYNPLGGISNERKIFSVSAYNTIYTYDRLGNQVTIVHPDTSTTTNQYNSAGQLEKIYWQGDDDVLPTMVVEDIDYAPTGSMSYIKDHNGVETTNTYDPTKTYRLTRKLTVNGGSTFQDINYLYTAAGDISSIEEKASTTAYRKVAYTYDDLHRLTQASSTKATNNYLENYSYNAIGNITTKSDQGDYLYAGTTTSNYANPHAPTSIGGSSLTYDNNGNVTTFSGVTNTWDYKNRLTQTASSSATSTMAYDHTGERVSLTDNTNGTTRYINQNYLTKVTGDRPTRYIYGNGELLVTIEDSQQGSFLNGSGSNLDGEPMSGEPCCSAPLPYVPTIHYIHTDHLSGTNIVTDSGGTLEQTTDTLPYGKVRVDETTTGFKEKHGFIGEFQDTSSRLSYLNARYLDPKTGQFLSQDPVFWEIDRTEDGKKVLLNPQLQNSYSYAGNNPVTNKDPQGRIVDTAADIAFIAYDLYKIGQALIKGESTKEHVQALGLDAAGTLIPGVTGLGMAARMVNKADDAVHGVKVIKTADEWSQVPFDPIKQRNFWLKGVDNEKLQNIIKKMFQPRDDIIGGTPAAVHYTKQTGILVGGSDHLIARDELIVRLSKLLKNPSNLNKTEFNKAKQLYRRLQKTED